jgi:hypothetical protein
MEWVLARIFSVVFHVEIKGRMLSFSEVSGPLINCSNSSDVERVSILPKNPNIQFLIWGS